MRFYVCVNMYMQLLVLIDVKYKTNMLQFPLLINEPPRPEVGGVAPRDVTVQHAVQVGDDVSTTWYGVARQGGGLEWEGFISETAC